MRLDLEELADLLHHHLRRLRPAAAHHRHRVHAAVERQAGDQPDHALLRIGQGVDQLGEVVFEEGLAVGA